MAATKRWAKALLLPACLLAGSLGMARPVAAATTSVTAVPALDLNRFMGAWFVVEQLPDAFQKHCAANDHVLYALDNKTGRFQKGDFCTLKKTNSPESANSSGSRDKFDDGRLKISHLVLFSRKYWVLAIAPDYSWAVVGSPNHKSLWILSRTRTLAPQALAEAQSRVTAQGFDTSRLVTIMHDPPGYAEFATKGTPDAH